MFKKLFLIVLGFISAGSLSAQNAQIKGRVFDAQSNVPLANATIQVLGNEGATSDKNGQFSLICRDSMLVTVSYIG